MAPSATLPLMQHSDKSMIRMAESSVPEEPSLPNVTVKKMNNSNGTIMTQQQQVRTDRAPFIPVDFTTTGPRQQKRRASTHRFSVTGNIDKELRNLLLNDDSGSGPTPATAEQTAAATPAMARTECCGGGCCRLTNAKTSSVPIPKPFQEVPRNDAFKSLNLKLISLGSNTQLTGVPTLAPSTVSFEQPLIVDISRESTVDIHPPNFVTPHPPYNVFSAKIHSSRCLTRDGAEKRTYHFDLDVTDYPEEAEGVDFRVGGAIGVCAPNDEAVVEAVFDRLGISKDIQDEQIIVKTSSGRWPTIWGEEQSRSLPTTRRELLMWTVDIQSYPPTKQFLRLMAEWCSSESERKILLYLTSDQGQAEFCELRSGPYLTLLQLLNAFPSCNPPLEALMSSLKQLMPRFYSLSSDPHESKHQHRRTIAMAVTVHEHYDWTGSARAGVGSGFFERQALKYIESGGKAEVRIPMFRGLMQNPLAKEFRADGPMLLIGAGVGVAPFRGFVQRRLRNANCANKVWVLQGIRDSLLDELYSGEWGVHEDEIKKVVESRSGTGRYVQEEVKAQADLVWFIINSVDGRVFVCGSSKGMGEGVEEALVEVAMKKGNLRREEAEEFWKTKKDSYQYIAETW